MQLNDILGNDTLHDIAELRSTWWFQAVNGGALTSEQQQCQRVIDVLFRGVQDQAEK